MRIPSLNVYDHVLTSTFIVPTSWFLDNAEGRDWQPPSTLLVFMAKARSEGKPLVYIGFGSITVPNPAEVTQRIYAAVAKSMFMHSPSKYALANEIGSLFIGGVRAIISKGWSARMHSGFTQDEKEPVPEDCYMLDKVPHE